MSQRRPRPLIRASVDRTGLRFGLPEWLGKVFKRKPPHCRHCGTEMLPDSEPHGYTRSGKQIIYSGWRCPHEWRNPMFINYNGYTKDCMGERPKPTPRPKPVPRPTRPDPVSPSF